MEGQSWTLHLVSLGDSSDIGLKWRGGRGRPFSRRFPRCPRIIPLGRAWLMAQRYLWRLRVVAGCAEAPLCRTEILLPMSCVATWTNQKHCLTSCCEIALLTCDHAESNRVGCTIHTGTIPSQ